MLRRICQHLFSFQGRAGRLEFFLHNLGEIAAFIFIYCLLLVLPDPTIFLFIFPFALLVGIISELAVTARRLHDLDQSGWMILAGLIPIYNLYQGIRLIFCAGTPGPNQYGPSPALASEQAREERLAAKQERRERKQQQKYQSPYHQR